MNNIPLTLFGASALDYHTCCMLIKLSGVPFFLVNTKVLFLIHFCPSLKKNHKKVTTLPNNLFSIIEGASERK